MTKSLKSIKIKISCLILIVVIFIGINQNLFAYNFNKDKLAPKTQAVHIVKKQLFPEIIETKINNPEKISQLNYFLNWLKDIKTIQGKIKELEDFYKNKYKEFKDEKNKKIVNKLKVINLQKKNLIRQIKTFYKISDILEVKEKRKVIFLPEIQSNVQKGNNIQDKHPNRFSRFGNLNNSPKKNKKHSLFMNGRPQGKSASKNQDLTSIFNGLTNYLEVKKDSKESINIYNTLLNQESFEKRIHYFYNFAQNKQLTAQILLLSEAFNIQNQYSKLFKSKRSKNNASNKAKQLESYIQLYKRCLVGINSQGYLQKPLKAKIDNIIKTFELEKIKKYYEEEDPNKKRVKKVQLKNGRILDYKTNYGRYMDLLEKIDKIEVLIKNNNGKKINLFAWGEIFIQIKQAEKMWCDPRVRQCLISQKIEKKYYKIKDVNSLAEEKIKSEIITRYKQIKCELSGMFYSLSKKYIDDKEIKKQAEQNEKRIVKIKDFLSKNKIIVQNINRMELLLDEIEAIKIMLQIKEEHNNINKMIEIFDTMKDELKSWNFYKCMLAFLFELKKPGQDVINKQINYLTAKILIEVQLKAGNLFGAEEKYADKKVECLAGSISLKEISKIHDVQVQMVLCIKQEFAGMEIKLNDLFKRVLKDTDNFKDKDLGVKMESLEEFLFSLEFIMRKIKPCLHEKIYNNFNDQIFIYEQKKEILDNMYMYMYMYKSKIKSLITEEREFARQKEEMQGVVDRITNKDQYKDQIFKFNSISKQYKKILEKLRQKKEEFEQLKEEWQEQISALNIETKALLIQINEENSIRKILKTQA